MFRKPVTVGSSHKVSGADRKKLRRSLEKAFALPEGSDALEALLPAKTGELELAKLPAPSRTVLYSLDGVPVLLDSSGKGDFVPTVMGLWRAPQLLPCVVLKGWQVSQFICGGADVMLPGVDCSSLPTFQRGALLAVNVPGNPLPIAVGAATMNSSSAATHAAANGKGKLVEVLQHYGDCLWHGLGAQPPGFQQGFVAPPQLVGSEAEAALSAAEAQSDDDDAAAAAPAGPADAAAAAAAPPPPDAGVQQLSLSSDEPQAAGQQQQQQDSSWPSDMDALLELSLLQALHTSVKDDTLPLNSTQLWAQHITPSRPPVSGLLLDVKRSKHKKMSKFLHVYAKAGLISVKEERHSGDTLLTAVNRSHSLYTSHTPFKRAAAAGAAGGAGEGSAAAAAAGGDQAAGGGAPLEALLVEEVYKPSREVKPIFEAVGASTDAAYSAAAAGDVAFSYVSQLQLDALAGDRSLVQLDPTLCDALFKGVIKKGELFPTHIAKAELRDTFLARCSRQTRISRGQVAVLRNGTPPSIHISTQRRQGNKLVTIVTGLEPFLVDPAALAQECQRKFATSTFCADLPGKHNPGQEVTLQGNLLEKLPAHLMASYGIPKKHILVAPLKK